MEDAACSSSDGGLSCSEREDDEYRGGHARPRHSLRQAAKKRAKHEFESDEEDSIGVEGGGGRLAEMQDAAAHERSAGAVADSAAPPPKYVAWSKQVRRALLHGRRHGERTGQARRDMCP